jgi:hypothetical protein
MVRAVLVASATAEPGTLVINYSPASFHYFTQDSVRLRSEIKLQDIIDEKIAIRLQHVLYTFGRRPGAIGKQIWRWTRGNSKRNLVWIERRKFSDGFVNVESRFNDGSPLEMDEYQLEMYGRVLREMDDGEQRVGALLGVVAEAKERGWRVVMVRLPVGSRMRSLEDGLRIDLLGDAWAQSLDIPYIDYNRDSETRNLETLDESHLTPRSARTMATRLASDVARLVLEESSARSVGPARGNL